MRKKISGILIVIMAISNLASSGIPVRNFNSEIVLGESNTAKVRRNIVPGVEVIEYVGNPSLYKGTITTIMYQLSNTNNKSTKIIKPHLYQASSDKKIDKELLSENVSLVKVEEKGKKIILQIDVSKYKISFPKDGIFIGLEFVEVISGKGEKIDPVLAIWRDDENTSSISFSKYKNVFDKKIDVNGFCFTIKISQ
jgi:hypothetical protein